MSVAMQLGSSWPGIAVRGTASLPLAYALPSTSLLCDCRIEVVPIRICSEAFDESRAMLKYPTDQIIRHPDVQNAVRAIGQNINVSTSHAEILQDVDGRDKPGHDEIECCDEFA
jgi:hypothetical protein